MISAPRLRMYAREARDIWFRNLLSKMEKRALLGDTEYFVSVLHKDEVMALRARGFYVAFKDGQWRIDWAYEGSEVASSSRGSPTLSLKENMNALEADLLSTALIKADGCRTTAANILGIGRTTLVEKLKRYNLGKQGK